MGEELEEKIFKVLEGSHHNECMTALLNVASGLAMVMAGGNQVNAAELFFMCATALKEGPHGGPLN
jgi:hypothetical protein